MIQILYDGKCSLCRKEIAHYQKIDVNKRCNWIDITEKNSILKSANITPENAMRYLHVIDDNNEIHLGVDAFILIWQQLPRWHYLSKIFKFPPIKLTAQYLYKAFASWRYKRIKHCATS